jgi:hypothetical protein
MQENRHHIKARMLKSAARAWGYPETEAENNFDPMVSMLLAACSIELEKISGDIQASQARVVERLVQLLSPDVLTGALPAHAIATALPVEKTTVLAADAQFYTHRKPATASDGEEPKWKDFFFTPTAFLPLNKASIRFMATGNRLYSINQGIGKEVIAHSDTGIALPPSTLWLAIDEPAVSLHQTSFYFELRSEANLRLFLHYLPQAQWTIDDTGLHGMPGMGVQPTAARGIDLANIMNPTPCSIQAIKDHINAFYKSFFITLTDKEGATIKQEDQCLIPYAISRVFSGKEAKVLQQQPLRWIAISFPSTIPNQLLQDVMCMMNCFPVMNSCLQQISHRMHDIVNVIPLQTEDLFLDLEEIVDEEGSVVQLNATEGEEAPGILMRNGGVGRFDERDAAALIDNLLQLLRDDSAAFSMLGKDFVNNTLKELQQSLNKLEQRLFSRQWHRGQTPYLVIRNPQKKPLHQLFVKYWSTLGAAANNIKAGTLLQLYKGGALQNNQAILVTTAQGGRNKLSTTESMLAYKSALLSKERLVTAEDIKAFCHYQLGGRIKDIHIQKGVTIQTGRKHGFCRTLDVLIGIPQKELLLMKENGELGFWTDNLKLLLEERSASLVPYRVFFNEAA